MLGCVLDESEDERLPVVGELCAGEFDDGGPEGFRYFALKEEVGDDNFFLDLLDDLVVELPFEGFEILWIRGGVT